MSRVAIALVAMVTVWSSASHAEQLIEVTQCGQALPKRAVGYLSADLDCSAGVTTPSGALHSGAAVYLGSGGALDLRGFTLTGYRYGVVCDDICTDGRCPKGTCRIFGGTIKDATRWGASGQTLKVHDLTVTGCGLYGVYVYYRLGMRDSMVSDNGEYGVLAWKATIASSTISGNDEFGVDGGFLRIKDSTVRPNGDGVECSPEDPCGDIAASRKPRLKSTTCDTSVISGDTAPAGLTNWGVCALD